MQSSAPETHTLYDEGLVGVVISSDLQHDDDPGYCFLIARSAITLAKKPKELGDFLAYLGSGSDAATGTKAKSADISDELARTRSTSIPLDSVDEILLKKPGLFFGGYVIIRTRRRLFRVNMRLLSVGGPELLDAYETLLDSFNEVAREKVRITRNIAPVVIDWPFWTPPIYSDSHYQLAHEPHLKTILALLAQNEGGMSNAEIDTALANYSQWTTIRHLRQLMTLGLIEYRPELFGNPGRYFITDLGRAKSKTNK